MFGKSCIDDFSPFGIYWQPNLLFGSFVAVRPVWKTNCTLLTEQEYRNSERVQAQCTFWGRDDQNLESGIWPLGLLDYDVFREPYENLKGYRCQRLSKHLILRRVPCWPGAGGCCGAPVRVCRRIHLVWSYESWWGDEKCQGVAARFPAAVLHVSYM